MNRRFVFKRLNNKGASLVVVLIAVAFVSILTAIILSAAATNFRLKIMNNKSKKTFYSAEGALEEVYAGLGEVTSNTMETAYLQVAQNLSKTITVGGDSYTIKIDNKDANAQLKELYYNELYNIVSSNVSNDTMEQYLSSFLSEPTMAYVSSYGNIDYNEKACSIIIEDVIVQYKQNEQNGDYYSTVAVDIEFAYPNKDFDFISNTKSTLETFLDYSIIAMEGVDIGNDSLPSRSSFAGGVFAGNEGSDGGINVNTQSTLAIGNDIMSSNIVSAGNIDVAGAASFSFDKGKLWCINLNAGTESQSGATITLGESGKVYVADDLNLEGNDSVVNLNSEYSGYSYDGTADTGMSSAIVINGRGSTLNAVGLKKLVLAGRAYIDFEAAGTDNYMTADSLSLRGIQQVYLVPIYYINAKSGVTMSPSNPMETSSITKFKINLNDFFAYELLNKSTPYTVHKVDGVAYFYLNFKSNDAKRKYINCVLSESYLENNISKKGSRWKEDRADLFNNYVTVCLKQFVLTGEINMTYAPDATIYSAGNMYNVGSAITTDTTTPNLVDVVSHCEDKKHRYTILQSFLYDIGSPTNDAAVIELPQVITIAGMEYSTGDISTTTAYNRVVDTESLDKLTEDYVNERPDNTVSAVIVSGSYQVPDYITGGVILGYNSNITVRKDFEGLIITNGKVNIYSGTQNAHITNGIRDVASRILDEDVKLSKYFYAYQMDTDNFHQTSIVDVNDLLSFNNWRKNYAD